MIFSVLCAYLLLALAELMANTGSWQIPAQPPRDPAFRPNPVALPQARIRYLAQLNSDTVQAHRKAEGLALSRRCRQD